MGVSSISRSSRVTRRVARSSVSEPASMTAGGRVAARRQTASTRAISSTSANGLTM